MPLTRGNCHYILDITKEEQECKRPLTAWQDGIYDALAVRAAEKAGVGRLVTLNETDFRRLCPDGGITITTP